MIDFRHIGGLPSVFILAGNSTYMAEKENPHFKFRVKLRQVVCFRFHPTRQNAKPESGK